MARTASSSTTIMSPLGYARLQSDGLAEQLKQAQLKQALKDVKKRGTGLGTDSSDSSSGGGGSSSGGGGSTIIRDTSDNSQLDFERQRTLLGDRADNELEAIRLKAKLESDRRKSSLGDAMSSLKRFR